MGTDIATLKQTAINEAVTGATYRHIAELLGISRTELFNIRQADPAFRDALETAMFDGSTMVVEELREVPQNEPCPIRARVKIEALRLYLELRWPHRYGKQLNVTVKTLDMSDALAKARARISQPIEMQQVNAARSTDSQSVDAAYVPVMAGIDEIL